MSIPIPALYQHPQRLSGESWAFQDTPTIQGGTTVYGVDAKGDGCLLVHAFKGTGSSAVVFGGAQEQALAFFQNYYRRIR